MKSPDLSALRIERVSEDDAPKLTRLRDEAVRGVLSQSGAVVIERPVPPTLAESQQDPAPEVGFIALDGSGRALGAIITVGRMGASQRGLIRLDAALLPPKADNHAYVEAGLVAALWVLPLGNKTPDVATRLVQAVQTEWPGRRLGVILGLPQHSGRDASAVLVRAGFRVRGTYGEEGQHPAVGTWCTLDPVPPAEPQPTARTAVPAPAQVSPQAPVVPQPEPPAPAAQPRQAPAEAQDVATPEVEERRGFGLRRRMKRLLSGLGDTETDDDEPQEKQQEAPAATEPTPPLSTAPAETTEFHAEQIHTVPLAEPQKADTEVHAESVPDTTAEALLQRLRVKLSGQVANGSETFATSLAHFAQQAAALDRLEQAARNLESAVHSARDAGFDVNAQLRVLVDGTPLLLPLPAAGMDEPPTPQAPTPAPAPETAPAVVAAAPAAAPVPDFLPTPEPDPDASKVSKLRFAIVQFLATEGLPDMTATEMAAEMAKTHDDARDWEHVKEALEDLEREGWLTGVAEGEYIQLTAEGRSWVSAPKAAEEQDSHGFGEDDQLV